MNQRIVFKYTTRSRESNFFRGLDSIVNNLANKEDYYIQVTCDTDDPAMNNPEVIARMRTYKNLIYYFGESSSKINAINNNLNKLSDFDILINMSDDQIFTQWGFDSTIRIAFDKYFPDTDGFLHFHDGNQNRLATMSIIGKKWFYRTEYIYHPSYITEWCDNEEQERAKILGKYHYMGDQERIMAHINPYHGHKDTMDDLYRKNAPFSDQDKQNFFKRQETNFYL